MNYEIGLLFSTPFELSNPARRTILERVMRK